MIFKHLLPNARAWRITVNKNLRRFFEGLTSVNNDITIFFNNVWSDIYPQTTRELDSWEKQFGLRDVGLDEQARRDRLDATWKAVGGQDPRYIQDTLQANGFDVYVHEWWDPDSKPSVGIKTCVNPRNPMIYLRREFTGANLLVECGEASAECGEDFAQAGNSVEPRGYPLVNKVFNTVPDILTLCGEDATEAGEPEALCGNYFSFKEEIKNYIVSDDPVKWHYFLYIGGETFGNIAQVDARRKDEFEMLCLKIRPAQQWLGVLVEYN